MVAFGHSAVGTIVGIGTYHLIAEHSDLALGLIAAGFAGVVSHYLMDLMPHGHFFRGEANFKKYINLVIIFDLFLPILLILSLAHFFNKSALEILYILFAIGGAQLPDILMGLEKQNLLYKTKIFQLESRFHMSTHWHGIGERALLFNKGDIWQFLAFILALVLIIK